ncbi:MAG: Tol-Pal system protein TolB, partial [Polaromonas sp.]|nr:Tol-Pal system protein TolB [Polaromonas sp.]
MSIASSLRRRTLVSLLAAGALPVLPVTSALAQFRVEVSGVGLTQLPIAIAAFRGDAQAPQKIGAIVRADLERSGMFRPVDTTGINADENTRPDLAAWRQKGADSMVTGSVTLLADGRYDV